MHDFVPAVASASSSTGRSEGIKAQIQKAIPRLKPGTGHLVSNNPEAGRQQAVNVWTELIKIELNSSTVGRQLLDILARNLTKEEEQRLAVETV